MRNPKIRRSYTLAFLTLLALSSATMFWLLWRYPLGSTLGTIGVLLLFGVAAHFSGLSDTDAPPAYRIKSRAR